MSRNFICFFLIFSSCNFFLKKNSNSLHIRANIELENSNNSFSKLKTSSVIEKDKINISVSTSFGLKILEMEYKNDTVFFNEKMLNNHYYISAKDHGLKIKPQKIFYYLSSKKSISKTKMLDLKLFEIFIKSESDLSKLYKSSSRLNLPTRLSIIPKFDKINNIPVFSSLINDTINLNIDYKSIKLVKK
tara:strand:- start:1128 stop:1694 length:567 start_codon:yes stop_codon:yes gene_type:complete